MSQPTVERRLASGAGLVLIYLFIQYAIPRPESVQPEGWRLLGIFVATIAGLILQPIPGGALVLMAVTLASLAGGLTIQEALGGYGDPTVWLVMAAFFISTAMIKTGLARRIALLFVRLVGRTSLGVTYALSATDMVLASIIPSNAARSGGVVLPIARSIAELYDSRPGPTASRLGTFLTCAVYQNICVTAAMLPGLASLIAGPLLVRRLEPPEIRRTPEAAAFAARELKAMGPIDWAQGTVLSIFVSVCGLWMTTPLHGLDIALTALLGSCALLAVGILTWEDVVSEKAAWSIFIWYGGLVRLGKALNDAGVTQEFAKGVGGLLPGSGWVLLFALALAIYFYSHYGFASITAHILAMFAPFAAVLIAKGAPVGLVVLAFACFTNLAAGLTHYGTTPSPMFFATNYASFRSFWRVGFAVSLLNIAIWTTLGFAWWKLIGVW
jgi:divalent anion:Na+ symporter, DASS family